MGKRFRDFSLPAVVINHEFEILDASEAFLHKYGWARTFLSLVDSGSQSKVAKFLPSLATGTPLEISMQEKKGKLDFVDLFVTWTREDGIVTVVPKSSQYSLVSSKLSLLQAELSIRNNELIEEKDRVQSLLVEMQNRSAPAIIIREGISLVPIFGAIDSEQMTLIFNRLLTHFLDAKTETAIIDFTASIDFASSHWQGVDEFVKAASIMGVEIIVSGLHPSQVKALNDLQIQTASIRFYAKLAAALQAIN